MPDGLMFMVPTRILPTGLSPLFSWKTKLRMGRELFHPPRAVDGDESVASFVERHYGAEMVDRLADPLLSGVYGGEAASLSVRAVLPRFAEMERSHGSLGRAMLAARKKMSPAKRPVPPLFTSLKDGMQHLAEAVVSHLSPASLLTGALVHAVQPEAGGWVVSAGLQSDHFDPVVLAEPLLARVYTGKAAMAQYGVGHLDRLDRIERLRQKLPGLALAGNGYRGIGVPDCVRSGRDAAGAVATS